MPNANNINEFINLEIDEKELQEKQEELLEETKEKLLEETKEKLQDLEKEASDVVIDADDSDVEEVDQGKLYGQEYDLPEDQDKFMDVNGDKVIDEEDIKNIPPMEIIRAVASKTGTPIQDPKKGCKSCYGRGYTGIETNSKMPIPCSCIHPSRTQKQREQDEQMTRASFAMMSRKNRRKLARMEAKIEKKRKKIERLGKLKPKKEVVDEIKKETKTDDFLADIEKQIGKEVSEDIKSEKDKS